jgi:hypothetical protein
MREIRNAIAILVASGDGERDVWEYSLPDLTEQEKQHARILSGRQLVDNGYGDYVNLACLRFYYPERAVELGLNLKPERE